MNLNSNNRLKQIVGVGQINPLALTRLGGFIRYGGLIFLFGISFLLHQAWAEPIEPRGNGVIEDPPLKTDFAIVRSCGHNAYGQLGDKNFKDTERNELGPVTDSMNFVTIAAGENHSLALDSNGSAWAWGNGASGQLGQGRDPVMGDPNYKNYNFPVKVKIGDGNVKLKVIKGGALHSLALDSDGAVWAWGNNDVGQLGQGDLESAHGIPVIVSNIDLYDVSAIAAGYSHNLVIQNGTVWAWGYGKGGQLGQGPLDLNIHSTPVQVKGQNGVGFLKNVVAIAAGSDVYYTYSLALKKDGTVWVWGRGELGILGQQSLAEETISTPVQVKDPKDKSGFLTDVIAIAAGYQHSLVLKKDGTVWAWGDNNKGQLGDETYTPKSLPVQMKGLPDLGLFGSRSISAGSGHSLVLTWYPW